MTNITMIEKFGHNRKTKESEVLFKNKLEL